MPLAGAVRLLFFLGDNQTTERIGERHLDLKVLSFFSRDLFFLSVRV